MSVFTRTISYDAAWHVTRPYAKVAALSFARRIPSQTVVRKVAPCVVLILRYHFLRYDCDECRDEILLIRLSVPSNVRRLITTFLRLVT